MAYRGKDWTALFSVVLMKILIGKIGWDCKKKKIHQRISVSVLCGLYKRRPETFCTLLFAVSLVIKKAQNKTFSLARKQNLHLDLNRLLTFVYLFPFFLSLYGQSKAPCPIVRYGYFIFLSLQISRLPADKERPVSRSAPVQNLGCSHVGCLHSTR